jgi:SAM-dependent methyltransferase
MHQPDSDKREWFTDWFNSPYYNLLYKHRNQEEAHQFIDKLLNYLQPQPEDCVLDLACGNGRYARYLAEKNLMVTGLDIAEANIQYARQFENEHLSFFQHDMRQPYSVNHFNYVFNFFTSFGYFETEREHETALKHIARSLRQGGTLVLDFFNTDKVLQQLVEREEKEINGIHFELSRLLDEFGYIVKNIQVHHNGKHMNYRERVRAYRLEDFDRMFEKVGLRIQAVFGNYALEAFEATNSDRLILIAGKA